jgi:outer membrane protein insertion porin family
MVAVRLSSSALAAGCAVLIAFGCQSNLLAQQAPPESLWPNPDAPDTEVIGRGLLSPELQSAGSPVADIRIVGNETVGTDEVVSYLRTRKDREFEPSTVQADKRRLITSGLFRDVRIYTQPVANGIVVTFEVFERPTIRYLRFLGDRAVGEKALKRESGLEVGDALNLYAVQEARRKIEDFYHRKGFPHAQVEILQGAQTEDRGVALQISEGPLQRIEKVVFIGNEIASDQRLKTMVQSKPGYLWYLFRGKVDQSKIEEDVDRLTAYYRGLGFFRARIGRELDYDDRHEWLTLRFVIDEGPRYVIDSVQFAGSTRFDGPELKHQLELSEGKFFNLASMHKDLNLLRDLYGSQGHIFADVQADPRFQFDEPGKLDLIYKVDEGKQFRVGRINIHIAGEFPHTRESVVRNRLSLRTGDIVDIREVRASERRLKASQLFENDPSAGKSPRIVIRPPQLSDAEELMASEGGRAVRGQSPVHRDAPREMILDVYPLAQERTTQEQISPRGSR